MKKYLFDEIEGKTIKNMPFNYKYIFSRDEKEIGKTRGKYVTCDFLQSNNYSVVPYYKPISTTLPKDLKELNNE